MEHMPQDILTYPAVFRVFLTSVTPGLLPSDFLSPKHQQLHKSVCFTSAEISANMIETDSRRQLYTDKMEIHEFLDRVQQLYVMLEEYLDWDDAMVYEMAFAPESLKNET